MTKFTLTHTINCTAETFWEIFFDKEFNETLYLKQLGFPSYSIVDQKETDAQITRRAKGQPKMDMPGPVMKIMGPGFAYTEEGVLDKAKKVFTWKTIPSTLADKIRHEGSLHIDSAGEGKVKRVTEIVLEAKIFGLGGLIESSTEKTIRKGWDDSAVFMNKWIADRAQKAAT